MHKLRQLSPLAILITATIPAHSAISAEITSPIIVNSGSQTIIDNANIQVSSQNTYGIQVGATGDLTLDGTITRISVGNFGHGVSVNGGTLTSNGMLDITGTQTSSGSLLGVTNGGTLVLNGTTHLASDSNEGLGLTAGASATVNGKLDININPESSDSNLFGIDLANDASLTASSGSDITISTTGPVGVGLNLRTSDSIADLQGTLNINTSGDNSAGISNNGTLNLSGSSVISTSGSQSYGIDTNASHGPAISTVSGSTITSTGNNAGGVQTREGASTLLTDVRITSSGDDSAGVNTWSNSTTSLTDTTLNVSGTDSNGIVVGSTVAGDNSRVSLSGSSVDFTGTGDAILLQNDTGITLDNSVVNSHDKNGLFSVAGYNTASLSNNSLLNAGQGTAVEASQGSTLTLTSDHSGINGNITTDDTGQVNATLSNDSVWNGSSSGNIALTLDKSLWNVNSDASVTSLTNGGAIVFADTSNGTPTAEYDTSLTVTGDYTGNNGYLVTNVDTGNDTADQLLIDGDATGNTNVAIGKVAATQATQYYIPVVTVDGDASAATFTQAGRASVGGYEFTLRQANHNGKSVWYLSDQVPSSGGDTGGGDTGGGDTGGGGTGGGGTTGGGSSSTPVQEVSPETAAYESINLMAYQMLLTTKHEREGSTFADTGNGTGVFIRTNGGRQSFSSSDGQLKTNSNMVDFELGAQLGKYAVNDGNFVWGLTASYGHGNSTSTSSISGYRAQGMIDGYTAGFYATLQQYQDETRGYYLDSWLKYANFQNSVKGDDMSEVTYHTNGISASLEAGYTVPVWEGSDNGLYMQPQVQFAWLGMNMKDRQDGLGNDVSSTDNGNLVSRLGLHFFGKGISPANRTQIFTPFIDVDYINNSSDGGVTYKSTMGTTQFDTEGYTHIGQVKVGVDGQLSNDVSVNAAVTQQIGGEGYHSTFGYIGAKITF